MHGATNMASSKLHFTAAIDDEKLINDMVVVTSDKFNELKTIKF